MTRIIAKAESGERRRHLHGKHTRDFSPRRDASAYPVASIYPSTYLLSRFHYLVISSMLTNFYLSVACGWLARADSKAIVCHVIPRVLSTRYTPTESEKESERKKPELEGDKPNIFFFFFFFFTMTASTGVALVAKSTRQ